MVIDMIRLIFLLLFFSCLQEGTQSPIIEDPEEYLNTLDIVEVEKNVTTLFQNRCQSCHGNNQPQNISDLESLKENSTFFIAGKPDISLLYQSLLPDARKFMPQGGTLTADEKKLVKDWILLVGKESETSEEEIVYTNQIQSIFEAKCFNCHNQETIDEVGDQMDRSNGNPLINSYESILNFTTAGSIEDSLIHELNFYNQGSHLPGARYSEIEYENLSESEMQQLETWIQQGAILSTENNE